MGWQRCVWLSVLVLSGLGCAPDPSTSAVKTPSVNPSPTPPATVVQRSDKADTASRSSKLKLTTFPRFENLASQRGIEFTYQNGANGRSLMVEATGGGAGWLDFDGDGLLDLYFCQGGDPAAEDRQREPSDQLFRQVAPGQFLPITTEAAINETQYSQGIAIADFDDDGFDDIYITNVGPNTLLRNSGDGTFMDVSQSAGVDNRLWSSSAAWGDLDGDRDLDLYVCNYVDYDPYHPIPCGTDGKPGTCHPMHMTAVPDECYFNQGDGTFTAESQTRGLFGPKNKALGVVIADLNDDALPDVYVANDTTANFLFINEGNGQFVESGYRLGCAVNRDGYPQASMGVALGDYDRDGRPDLFCTHFTKEANTLYQNIGPIGFQDVTSFVGLYQPALSKLGFGTIMADFNQDGHEDIFVTNGHIDDWREKGDDWEMVPQLFSFEGPQFIEVSDHAGDFFQQKNIGRGVARADYDDDGDWDLAVVHQNKPAALLENTSQRGHWLKVLCYSAGSRRGWGTRVTLMQGSQKLVQELAGGTSYCAAHEAALIFGLGDGTAPVTLQLRWPDGSESTIDMVEVDQRVVVRQPRSPAQH